MGFLGCFEPGLVLVLNDDIRIGQVFARGAGKIALSLRGFGRDFDIAEVHELLGLLLWQFVILVRGLEGV